MGCGVAGLWGNGGNQQHEISNFDVALADGDKKHVQT